MHPIKTGEIIENLEEDFFFSGEFFLNFAHYQVQVMGVGDVIQVICGHG
jgi:hypothetical protein